jgi:glucose-induced degradation protein 8
MTLLAFEDSKENPMNSLLDISHRHKTASELNSAILDSQCQEKCKTKFYNSKKLQNCQNY